MILFETYKYKYDIKEKEITLLMVRVDELSKINGDL